ncbi:porin [Marinifilum fragile]|uniref:OprO/OprP family phosphate-selective porin n=1 Tax=Marinifilum fragile TaxID=570161 RepID=UPI002AA8B712|nr:porin [Marinifilum fragile]
MKNFTLSLLFLLIVGNSMAQKNSTLNWIFQNDTSHFQTKNQKFKLRFGGRIFADAAYYFEDKTELESGGEIRDLRLRFDLAYAKKWSASINVDFSEMEVNMKDTYVKYSIDSNSFLRAGYFLEPFGIEQTESTNLTMFMHVASTVEAFRPGRNIGVEYNWWNKSYNLGLGIFGDFEKKEEKGSSYYYYGYNPYHSQYEKSLSFIGYGVSSRLSIVPVQTNWNILHLGVSGNYWIVDNEDKTVKYYSRAATHIEIEKFIGVKIDQAKSQLMYGLELIYANQSFSFQSEFIKTRVNRESEYHDYIAEGWYAQFGWMIKGGNYKYNKQTARLFQPNKGAIELTVRYNETDLYDTSNYYFTGMGGRQRDYTVGCNWYITQNMMAKLNYSNVDLDKYAINGEENFNMIQTRLQFSF